MRGIGYATGLAVFIRSETSDLFPDFRVLAINLPAAGLLVQEHQF
jgi:hypothetical protein